MKIEKTLKIKIEQADVEAAIRELVYKEDPTIVVDSISFAAKRTGEDSISISIDAHFDEGAPTPRAIEVPTTEEAAPFTPDTPVEEVEEEEVEDPEPVAGKTSLFS